MYRKDNFPATSLSS